MIEGRTSRIDDEGRTFNRIRETSLLDSVDGKTIPGESMRVIAPSSLTSRDSLVTPASAPVVTFSPCPRRFVSALIMLDFPVFGNPMTPTEMVCLSCVERDLSAL